MARSLKIYLPVLILLALLTSCTGSNVSEIYKPGTAVPSEPTPTAQPDQEQERPASEDPTPLPTEEDCQETSGSVEAYQIPWGDETLAGSVYLPPCYLESGQRYPALYLLHGATKTDQHWLDLGLAELADDLINRGEIPPLIIILPREDTWIVLSENYFGDNLVQGVIPWMDREYRTLAERDYRAIGGISRGGNWAVRLGLLHWEMFGSVGAHSSPLFYMDLYRLPSWVKDVPRGDLPRIYLDISEGDTNLDEAVALRGVLAKESVAHEWHLYPGLHNDTYWRSHLEEYLLWYSAGWKDR